MNKDDMRQKTKQMAFSLDSTGETQRTNREGLESSIAHHASERFLFPDNLMEQITEPRNLMKATRNIISNGGSPGADGMTTKELPEHMQKNWNLIRGQLLQGTYKPQPVKRAGIPKPDGTTRYLGIPTVLDRMIQQAILQVLQPTYDRTFSKSSYGFRPTKSAHHAVTQAKQYIQEGYAWVVDIDLEKFFDRVNHDRLMSTLAKRIPDKRLLKLIRAYLNSGVMDNGLIQPTHEGTPQGGPLSPLLSNIVLDELDKELEKRGHRFARYADDSNIYVKSERAGQRVMASITAFIEKKLKLKVNPKKSAVAQPKDRKFLGFSFFVRDGEARVRIAPKALQKFRDTMRTLTNRHHGTSMSQTTARLSAYLQGWGGYFSVCQTPSAFRDLDSWIRRRLRSKIWKQWKNPRTRIRELQKQGVPRLQAIQVGTSSKGPWRLSHTKAVQIALPNIFFDQLGLIRLTTIWEQYAPLRAAVYGPVRTVV